jgi:hypothetical protein
MLGIAVCSMGEAIAVGIEVGEGFFREVLAQAVGDRQIKIVEMARRYRYLTTNRLSIISFGCPGFARGVLQNCNSYKMFIVLYPRKVVIAITISSEYTRMFFLSSKPAQYQ